MISTGIIAVLADIHGNSWALDAVLAHARRQGVARILTLGDLAYGPLDPGGVIDRLVALDIPALHIRGNEDRVLWEPEASAADHPSLAFTRASLRREHLEWMSALPAECTLEDVLLCHGSPGDDTRYLLETVAGEGIGPSTGEEIARRLERVTERLVLCGHSHLPRCVQVPGGPLVVNPGSVGLPAYVDGAPRPYPVQAGSPHARYALVERAGGDWLVSLVAVPYDRESAARAATAHARPDWATALRTGWAQGA